MATRNPVNSPVEVGSLSIPLISRGFSTIPGSPPRWVVSRISSHQPPISPEPGMSQVLAACLPGTVSPQTSSDGTSNWEAVQQQVGQHGDEQDTLGCPLSNSGKWRLIRISWWWLLPGGTTQNILPPFFGEGIKHEYQIYLDLFLGWFFSGLYHGKLSPSKHWTSKSKFPYYPCMVFLPTFGCFIFMTLW